MSTAPQGPLVSVIIPAHNAESTLAACLRAIQSSRYRPAEILVVCDGCADRTEALAVTFGVRVIRNQCRQGAAYARNVGARAARGDVFFFIDADCVVQPDTLGRGAAAIAAGADVIFGSYTAETSARGFLAQFKNYQHHYTHQQGATIQTSFWSGCGAVTRESFDAIAGFDVTLHACEDIEFGWALTRAGYSVRLLKPMQVEHLKAYTLRGLVRSDLGARAIPWTRLIRAGRSEMGKLNTGRDGVRATAWTGALWLASTAALLLPSAGVAAACALAGVAWHSRGLLGFIRRKRGIGFALGSLAALVLHYTICGAGFAIGQLIAPYPRARAGAPKYRYLELEADAIQPPAVALEVVK